MEIEKKYLVSELPNNIDSYQKKEIEQGYLCTKPVVRIRKSNEDYYLTYKSPFHDVSKNHMDHKVLVNNEIEMPLTKEAYEHMKLKADHNIIRKTRYLIPLENGLLGEFDVFHDNLEGLYFIEVEFPSEEAANTFCPPSWFLKDVTSDKRFRNNYLISVNDIKELNLIHLSV